MFKIILFTIYIVLITSSYAQLPDLTVGSVSGPSTGNINQAIAVNVTINRTGGPLTNGTYVMVRVYLSTDNNITTSDIQIGESTSSQFLNSTLNTSGTASGTIACTLPGTAATYYIGAIVDPVNFHPESNESNNSKAGNIIQIGRLTITAPNGGEVWTKGNQYTIQWTSQNVTGTVDIDIYKGSTNYARIGNGVSNSGSFTWTPPTAWPDGSDYRAAISGMGGNVWDFSDNYFTLQSPSLPDLTISTVVSSSYNSGQGSVQVPVTVYRSGGQLTLGEYVDAHIFWSTNSTYDPSDIRLWRSYNSPPYDFPNTYLNTYGSKTVTATINIPNVTSGTYYIIAVVDSSNFHPESNEGNNATIYPVSISTSGLLLIEPSLNQNIYTEHINFSWSDVGADYYKIIVDNNSGLGSREVFDSVTTTTHTVPGYFLEANTYYWKVIAYFSDGSSIESDVSYFHYDPPKLQEPYWIPLYRLYKADDKDHFYCTTQEQRLDADSAGYVEEGIEGHISAKPFDHPDMKNIFRLYSDQNKAHFYTTDGNEKDIKIQEGYTYEGIVGFSYANQLPDLVPMYRLKKDFGGTPPNIDYFCTISWAERKYAEDNYGFTYDSIMTYVSPNNGKLTEPLALGQIMAALGVNTQNGNFQSPVIKSFNIADKGISLNFSHFYNSLSAVLFTDRKPLGPGWTHTYNAYITYSDLNAVNSLFNIIWPDGDIHTYYKEGSNYSCTTPGIYDSIDVLNFPLHIKVIKKDQTVYEFKTPTGALWGSPALLTSITDKNGNILSCQYNVVNQMAINLSNVTGTTGRNLTFTYYTEAGKENLIKTVQDPAGRTINFEYDTLGNLIRFIDAENKPYNYEYNSPYQQDRLMTKFIYPNGNFIENHYDSISVNGSNIKYVKDQLEGSTLSKFEIRFNNSTPGSPYSTVKDPNGEIWKYTSGSNNFVQEIFNTSLNFAINYERLDPNNPTLPTKITDGRGNSTYYTYDLKGNVKTISQPEGAYYQFWYDSRNNLTKYRNPRSVDFDYSYDGNSNLTQIITPSGTTLLSYLSGGLVQSIQNPLNQTTSFSYNQYGNIASSIDPLNYITSYIYDGVSRLTMVTNPKMQITSYTYDKRDLITLINDPSGQTAYTYDDNGNLKTVTNAKGQTTTLSYHPVTDWLISIQNSIGNQTNFNYHNNGLLQSKTDAMFNTASYHYDNAGRLTSLNSPTRTSNMSYDPNNNLETLTDNSKYMSFTYDGLNRLKTYTDYYNNTITYTYDPAGNVTNINYNPGNKNVQYTYDNDNRLLFVTDWNGKQTAYTYRADGTIQQISYPNGVVTNYNYDNASRITGMTTTGPSGTIAQYSFTLDAVSNHTQESILQPLSPVPNLSSESISYSYDMANRIQSAGNINYSFNANGNLTSRTEGGVTTSYTFNAENLLTGINGNQTNFIYDVFGNRREATRNGVNRRYVLDINGPMSQVLVETDENNNPINYYVYGLGLVSRIKPDGTTHYYHGDFRGSTVAMTNSVGTVTHKYSYDAFGNVIEQDEPDYNPFKYVGVYGVMEETHGLQFMRARYYDPEIGRFISEDPIWDVNLYPYSDNNPLSSIDPLGSSNVFIETGRIFFRSTFNEIKSSFKNSKWYWALLSLPSSAAKGMIKSALEPAFEGGLISETQKIYWETFLDLGIDVTFLVTSANDITKMINKLDGWNAIYRQTGYLNKGDYVRELLKSLKPLIDSYRTYHDYLSK